MQYGAPFAASDLAQSVANNLGLSGDANAALAVRLRDALEAVTDPNPARVPYLRGEVLLAETERFTTLVDDPVYGEAARRFNAEIAAALKYALIDGTLNALTNPDGSPVELPPEPEAGGRVSGWAFTAPTDASGTGGVPAADVPGPGGLGSMASPWQPAEGLRLGLPVELPMVPPAVPSALPLVQPPTQPQQPWLTSPGPHDIVAIVGVPDAVLADPVTLLPA